MKNMWAVLLVMCSIHSYENEINK